MPVFRTILHPTDFSPESRPAFELACDLARSHGAKLILLHVLERPVFVHGGAMSVPPPPPSEDERQTLEQQLQQLQPCPPEVSVERLLVEGEPSVAIIRVAKEKNCDLIVLGTHGRTGLKRLLLGSVAEKVLRGAPCPVLTMRTPATE